MYFCIAKNVEIYISAASLIFDSHNLTGQKDEKSVFFIFLVILL